ncbi:hypothetical protein [Burkholderia vietnamiensis]|uniref:hypothetical protein n=1 Tax=Burkholderia vietnamiensis TaxID=60552 RepID=UPI0012D8F0D5|nr:hypothetical protein [Burkholderia vietnamiensis]
MERLQTWGGISGCASGASRETPRGANHPNDAHLIDAIKAAVLRETPKSGEYHWADDSYWTEALDRYIKLRESGKRELTIDLDRLESLIFNGDGPAYKATDARCRFMNATAMNVSRAHRALCVHWWSCLHIHEEVKWSVPNDGFTR